MKKESVKTIDLNTNEETVREMTGDEFAQYQADQDLNAERKAEAEAKANAKSNLLERLGLTEDEVQLLLS